MERMEGIEPSSKAWKALAQPIYHTRKESQALKISLVATLFLRLLTHLKGSKVAI